MMHRLLVFWALAEPNVVWVLTGVMVLGACCGLVGTIALVQKRALSGDVLAHAALPGVTIAFALTHSRSPIVLLTGALVSSFLGVYLITLIGKRSRVKPDSAAAIVLSSFFAIGAFHLSSLQRLPDASQSGLDKLLFGQAASLVRSDVTLLLMVGCAVAATIVLCFERLRTISFDRTFALAQGISVPLYEGLFGFALAVSVVVGLQLVGVVLMAALIVTPAATARLLSDRLECVAVWAVLIGVFGAAMGASISFMAPKMPTGPWIVVSLTAIFLVVLVLAPRQGIFARYRQRAIQTQRIFDENILRTMYQLGERQVPTVSPADIVVHRSVGLWEVERGFLRLNRQGLVREQSGRFTFSVEGYKKAEHLTRSHRLWELYLQDRLGLPADHVHEHAEHVEHFLTPELQSRIEEELSGPLSDPHGREIPKGGKDES